MKESMQKIEKINIKQKQDQVHYINQYNIKKNYVVLHRANLINSHYLSKELTDIGGREENQCLPQHNVYRDKRMKLEKVSAK
jgi:hypothetical protein